MTHMENIQYSGLNNVWEREKSRKGLCQCHWLLFHDNKADIDFQCVRQKTDFIIEQVFLQSTTTGRRVELEFYSFVDQVSFRMTSSSNGESLDEDSDNILEGTLALIKPDAVDRAKDIISIILSEGFLIVEKKRFRFSREVIWKSYYLVRRIKLIKIKIFLHKAVVRVQWFVYCYHLANFRYFLGKLDKSGFK